MLLSLSARTGRETVHTMVSTMITRHSRSPQQAALAIDAMLSVRDALVRLGYERYYLAVVGLGDDLEVRLATQDPGPRLGGGDIPTGCDRRTVTVRRTTGGGIEVTALVSSSPTGTVGGVAAEDDMGYCVMA